MSTIINFDPFLPVRPTYPRTLIELINKLRCDFELALSIRREWEARSAELGELEATRVRLKSGLDEINKELAMLSARSKDVNDAKNARSKSLSSLVHVCQIAHSAIDERLQGTDDKGSEFREAMHAFRLIQIWINSLSPGRTEKWTFGDKTVAEVFRRVEYALTSSDRGRVLARQPPSAGFFSRMRQAEDAFIDQREIAAARAMQTSGLAGYDPRVFPPAWATRQLRADEKGPCPPSSQDSLRLSAIEREIRSINEKLDQPRAVTVEHYHDPAPLIDNAPKRKRRTSRSRRATTGGSKSAGKKKG